MSERPSVEFEVVAADSGTELFLIDGHFSLVKKGIGRARFAVPPGIYKIKARSGRTSTEKMVVVRPGMPSIRLDPIAINSAIPLLHSTKTHEFHMMAARQAASAPPSLVLGSGSALVIVVRQWTGPQPPSSATSPVPHPARGMTLRDLSGTVLVDLAHQTSASPAFDPCVALHVAVDPGAYRLSYAYDNGRRVEQAVVASPGWQTHIYVLNDHVATREARANPVNSAISMRRPNEGFREDDPNLRAEEIARGALVGDHKILSDEMREQFVRPDCSPMLALVGAHLLIREAQNARDRREDTPDDTAPAVDNRLPVRTIVDNLRASIGAHPDVEAIAIGAGNPDPAFVFVAPPLFRASWQLLLKASAQRAELVPAGSFGTRIAERVWGEGSWLLWLDPDTPDAVDRSLVWQAKARDVLLSIRAKASDIVADRAAADHTTAIPTLPMPTAVTPGTTSSAGDALSAAFRLVGAVIPRLKAAFTTRARTPFPDAYPATPRTDVPPAPFDLGALRARLNEDQWRSLIKTVGIPKSSISAWLDRLGE